MDILVFYPRWGLAALCLPSTDIARLAPAAAESRGSWCVRGDPRSSAVIHHRERLGRRSWASSLLDVAAAHHPAVAPVSEKEFYDEHSLFIISYLPVVYKVLAYKFPDFLGLGLFRYSFHLDFSSGALRSAPVGLELSLVLPALQLG